MFLLLFEVFLILESDPCSLCASSDKIEVVGLILKRFSCCVCG